MDSGSIGSRLQRDETGNLGLELRGGGVRRSVVRFLHSMFLVPASTPLEALGVSETFSILCRY